MKIKNTTKKLNELDKQVTRLVLTDNKKTWHRLVEKEDGTLEYKMGIGKAKEIDHRQFITLVRTITQAANSHSIEKIGIEIEYDNFVKLHDLGEEWFYSVIAENICLAAYKFDKYKSNKNEASLKEVTICGKLSKKALSGLKRGEILGHYMNAARDIANTPGDDMLPKDLAQAAKDLAKGLPIKVKIFDEKQIKQEKLHALWAVGKGAEHMPRFIIMEYFGAKSKTEKPIVLVGKGITYDTGGLNVKPSGYMHDMHLDMSGGSSVIGAISAAAKLGLKKNVVAIIPAAENAVSDRAMRAGDIISSHAGKTIEVLHTDAEGRLVLADGLSYASKYKPKAIVDVATLTGAALVALGQHASAIMTNNQDLEDKLRQFGEESGDYVWPLPLWDEYKEHIKSNRADVANIMPNFSKYGGTIEGGAFLSHFAPNCPWAHIDIAPRMEAAKHDKLSKGSTGEPVRLLVKLIEKY